MKSFTLTSKGTLEAEDGSRLVLNYLVKLIKNGEEFEVLDSDGYTITKEILIKLITNNDVNNLVNLAMLHDTEVLYNVIIVGGVNEFRTRQK